MTGNNMPLDKQSDDSSQSVSQLNVRAKAGTVLGVVVAVIIVGVILLINIKMGGKADVSTDSLDFNTLN